MNRWVPFGLVKIGEANWLSQEVRCYMNSESTCLLHAPFWSLAICTGSSILGFHILKSNLRWYDPCEDVWRRTDNNIDFLFNGNETEYWNKFLESENIGYAVLLDDVQRAIEKEDLMKKYGYWRRGNKINWSSYASLSDIYDYLKNVVAASPSLCTLQTIGKTIQKKDIKMLKLSTGKPSNRAFFLEAGMHGREWVAVSSLLYFIEHIAWNFSSQPEHIKNKDCSNWGQNGASKVICSVLYCGPTAFSEAESMAIKNVISSRHFTGYVGIHSYGSTVFFPWASSGQPSGLAALHTKIAKEMVMAMRAVAKEHFRAGTVSQLHSDKASGMALDWMFSQGVQHAYLVETRGGSSGQFLLEANQILPAAKEVAAGLVAMSETIR